MKTKQWGKIPQPKIEREEKKKKLKYDKQKLKSRTIEIIPNVF